MAPRIPRPQEFFFYDSDWNATFEKEFLTKLSDHALAANTTLGQNDVIHIRRAMSEVNGKYGTSFSRKDAMKRFKQLKHRHEVFGYLITLPLVHYESDNNIITAPPFVWDYITLKYPIAEAYMRSGESNWTDFCIVFGTPQPIDVFQDREVIEISDDRSIPCPQGANIPIPNHASDLRAHSPSALPPSFWNELPRIVSRSDVASQDSVQYPPTRNDPFTPNELLPVSGHENRSPDYRARPTGPMFTEPSIGEAGCSSHASSATPKKQSRHEK